MGVWSVCSDSHPLSGMCWITDGIWVLRPACNAGRPTGSAGLARGPKTRGLATHVCACFVRGGVAGRAGRCNCAATAFPPLSLSTCLGGSTCAVFALSSPLVSVPGLRRRCLSTTLRSSPKRSAFLLLVSGSVASGGNSATELNSRRLFVSWLRCVSEGRRHRRR